MIEIIFYAINKMLLEQAYGVVDVGGSMVIHMFGAFFGVMTAFMLREDRQRNHRLCRAERMSDLFAMIGTIFLWMFWPSFNAVLTPATATRNRAIVNTLVALLGACVSSFAFSVFLRKSHKFNMVDIQNATLAGGVAIGSSVSLAVTPGGALLIGSLGGIISTCGYNLLLPRLEEKLKLHDTCGVLNLHGLPAVFAAIVSSIVCAAAGDRKTYGDNYSEVFQFKYSSSKQAGIQILSLVNTLAFALVGGAITGLILRQLKGTVTELYEDGVNWDEEEEEEEEAEKKEN